MLPNVRRPNIGGKKGKRLPLTEGAGTQVASSGLLVNALLTTGWIDRRQPYRFIWAR
jgi:hypothetical protein